MQLSATLPANLRRIGRAVVDGVLPPRCLACGAIVDEPDSLCGPCWAGMTFFAPPWCAICGLAFPHPMGEDAVCADCARQRASWDRARAVIRYDKHSRHLVLALKHGDRTQSPARSAAGCGEPAPKCSRAPICWCRYGCTGRGS